MYGTAPPKRVGGAAEALDVVHALLLSVEALRVVAVGANVGHEAGPHLGSVLIDVAVMRVDVAVDHVIEHLVEHLVLHMAGVVEHHVAHLGLHGADAVDHHVEHLVEHLRLHGGVDRHVDVRGQHVDHLWLELDTGRVGEESLVVVAEGVIGGDNLDRAEVVAGPAVDVVRLILAIVFGLLLAGLIVPYATIATAAATPTSTYAARRGWGIRLARRCAGLGAAPIGIGVELIGMKLARRLHVDIDANGVAAVLGLMAKALAAVVGRSLKKKKKKTAGACAFR